jgi:hypothetical protein
MDTEQQAFKIPLFCQRNNICVPFYYKLKSLGLGPREMRFGSAVRISIEAERDWRAARETLSAEASLIAKERTARGRKAGAAAAASPRHVTKQRAKKAVAS